jgi:hypothetical protein
MSKTLNLASFFLLFTIVFVVIIMSPSLSSSIQLCSSSYQNFQVDKYPSEIRELVNEAKSDFSKVDLRVKFIKRNL